MKIAVGETLGNYEISTYSVWVGGPDSIRVTILGTNQEGIKKEARLEIPASVAKRLADAFLQPLTTGI